MAGDHVPAGLMDGLAFCNRMCRPPDRDYRYDRPEPLGGFPRKELGWDDRAGGRSPDWIRTSDFILRIVVRG
jgi:hypothetical protein